jgi:hypothetical protein
MTVRVDVDANNLIQDSAPIVRKFIGQTLSNLTGWMKKQGGFRSKELRTNLYYAGIGSRTTPPEFQEYFSVLGQVLQNLGWTLRSGGADGADSAFEKYVTRKEIYLP